MDVNTVALIFDLWALFLVGFTVLVAIIFYKRRARLSVEERASTKTPPL